MRILTKLIPSLFAFLPEFQGNMLLYLSMSDFDQRVPDVNQIWKIQEKQIKMANKNIRRGELYWKRESNLIETTEWNTYYARVENHVKFE